MASSKLFCINILLLVPMWPTPTPLRSLKGREGSSGSERGRKWREGEGMKEEGKGKGKYWE